jgi:Peptidase family M1 domain/Carboxypeptidase regulatory-like domain
MSSRFSNGASTGVLVGSLFLSFLSWSTFLNAATVSGTVKDPSGAVVAEARIELSGGNLAETIVLASDAVGRFRSPDLQPGTYRLRITHEGFGPLLQTVDLHQSLDLQLRLEIERIQSNISVSGKSSPFANSDPLYRQLRTLGLGDTFRFDDFTVISDAGTFQFEKGTLTFFLPVEGVVTGAIFLGDGRFHLKPAAPLDRRELSRRIGAEEVDEGFSEVVFRFSGDIRLNFLPGLKARIETPEEASIALERWREKVRQRREIPITFSQHLLEGESMDNVDADVLAAIYNRSHPAFLNAYIHGKKYKDLRFFLRTRVGALAQLDSPEEVALVNCASDALDDGIWYLAHLQSEYRDHSATSSEDRRLFATRRYKIETVIAKNGHLFSTATITFEPLIAGERVLKFALLPNLRVTRVMDQAGQDLYFVQESRKEDGSFYAILQKEQDAGKEFSITVEYAGDHVLEQAGEGSYYVRARTSWYPNLNGFGEHAFYDLTYRVPRKYKVVSVGKLEAASIEDERAVSHWVTPVPVAVAGFNYGEYKTLDLADEITGYKISGYYLTELPDRLRNYGALKSLAPTSMTKYALEQTRAQMQLCTHYFGKIPYQDISITEQPDFNFGQSWPNLVYLPISAYTDSTQRWMLFGQINNRFTGFVQEVTPHEVAHQWWGHAVGWASYHDQWLSEGFAEFSAGLFLQFGTGGDWRKDYLEFWDRLRKRILEKNLFNVAPNDAGPLWMGLRLISPRTQDAYQNLTYPKGAYVLNMLRSILHSDNDQAFIDMMHDFVESHRDRPASTESLKAIAEKHMTKMMDLAGNGRLDWFFNEWVYGTSVPKYHFDYQISPADAGKAKLHMSITQSEVDDHFVMLVPVFADFGKGMVRIGQVGVAGNSTRSLETMLPAAPKKVALNYYRDILER